MYICTYVHARDSIINLPPLATMLNSNITVAQLISVHLVRSVAISSQSYLSDKSSNEKYKANCCTFLFNVHSSLNCGGLYVSY